MAVVGLIDTHTHFDLESYDTDRQAYDRRAYDQGVRHVVLIGYLAKYFARMARVKAAADTHSALRYHLAFGLHPLYIKKHCESDLAVLEKFIQTHKSIAIAEIGLDTYDKSMYQEALYAKQQHFFAAQIELAKAYDLPIALHIRKAHADAMRMIKAARYDAHTRGGVAHSFSGGVNEALAYAQMGFKIGVTGQVTNPNAKKLRSAVMAVYGRFGAGAFVIETDCPDMLPLACQHQGTYGETLINEPANLICVLDELARLFDMDRLQLANILWRSSDQALRLSLSDAPIDQTLGAMQSEDGKS